MNRIGHDLNQPFSVILGRQKNSFMRSTKFFKNFWSPPCQIENRVLILELITRNGSFDRSLQHAQDELVF